MSLLLDEAPFSLPHIIPTRSNSSGHSHERRPSEVPLLETQPDLEKQFGAQLSIRSQSNQVSRSVHYASIPQEEDGAQARSSESLPHIERGPIVRQNGNRESITRLLHGPPQEPSTRSIQGFERPLYLPLILLVLLCGFAYAVLVFVSALARNKSIFWARFIVASGSTFAGLSIAINIMLMARKFLEAAAWATIIHQSRLAGSPGVRLKDVNAHSYDPTHIWPALRLLWDRWAYPGTARKERTQYDRHPWSLYILLYVFSCVVATWIPFGLARTVLIEPLTLLQERQYREIPVIGSLSEAEIAALGRLLPTMEDESLQWTFNAWRSGSPPTLSFDWGNHSMYTPEVRWAQVADQLQPGPARSSANFRYPRWGIRVRCANSREAGVSIVPIARSNVSYVFTPRRVLRRLFDGFQLSFPKQLEEHPNWTEVINEGDLLPAGLDLLSTALADRFPHNGNSFSLKSYAIEADPSWQGFATVETTLIRLNTSFAPGGAFTRVTSPPQGAIPDRLGRPTYIGYDASVCLLAYEPWMMEVHHRGSGFLVTHKCLGTGVKMDDFDSVIGTQRQERFGPEWDRNDTVPNCMVATGAGA